MLFRRSEAPEDQAAQRARIVKLSAEAERLREEAQRDLQVRLDLAWAVRTMSLELCATRVELRDVRRAYDWSAAAENDLNN